MTRSEFEQLVEKYRLGLCSAEELAFVEKWLEFNTLHLDEDDSNVFESPQEADQIEQEIWNHLRKETGVGFTLTHRRTFWAGVAAACVLLMSAAAFYFYVGQNTDSNLPVISGLATYNSSTTSKRVTLSDSSIVTLEEGASITVDDNFGIKNRVVRLNGEAHFDIQHNPQLPFLVYTGELVTEVLGTSFRIKPDKNNIIEVSVTRGKVSVYSYEKDLNHRRNGVIITSNQKAVYDRTSRTIRQDLVEAPAIISPSVSASTFIFDDTPLQEVVDILQSVYGMEIVISNQDLNGCLFTGDLTGYSIFKQLDFVCDIIGLTYEIRGSTIFIGGPGCLAQ